VLRTSCVTDAHGDKQSLMCECADELTAVHGEHDV